MTASHSERPSSAQMAEDLFGIMSGRKSMSSDEQRTLDLLRATLGAAVPINIMDLRGHTFEERAAFVEGDAQIIASEGDNILYPGPKRGASARAFNALARALAVLAFQPGGVKAFGLHFEADGEPDPPLNIQLAIPGLKTS